MVKWIILIMMLCGAAHAQCPGSNESFSFPLPAPMQYATYDLLTIPGIPAGLLTVTYLNGNVETFFGVQQQVAQSFEVSPNQAQFFANQIKPVFHELLMITRTGCPLLTQAPGALWTR